MFERFTDAARRTVIEAQEAAQNLNHNYMGTEHLLLGLLRANDLIVTPVLESIGVTQERVREQVVAIIGEGQQQAGAHPPFTPRAKKVLELGLREALQLGQNYIGSEHLMLGIIREGSREGNDPGVAMQILVQQGLEPSTIRNAIIQKIVEVGDAARPERFGQPVDYDIRPVTAKVVQVERFVLDAAPNDMVRDLMIDHNSVVDSLGRTAAHIRALMKLGEE